MDLREFALTAHRRLCREYGCPVPVAHLKICGDDFRDGELSLDFLQHLPEDEARTGSIDPVQTEISPR